MTCRNRNSYSVAPSRAYSDDRLAGSPFSYRFDTTPPASRSSDILSIGLRTLPFTFETVDDIAVAARDGSLTVNERLLLAVSQHLGPAIELLYLKRTGSPLLQSVAVAPGPIIKAISGALSQNTCSGTKYGSRFGVVPVVRRKQSAVDQTEWYEWCARCQQAAERVGFPKEFAQGLIGALQELETNVHEHSGAAKTGVAAYQALPNGFEFVVADAGIGVLGSLRQSSEFRDLEDCGQALCLALSDGISRFGRAAKRGHGFQTLFRTLTGQYGSLRFRSGDHALTLDGQSPGPGMARVSQKPPLPGFIVSVLCRRHERHRRKNAGAGP